LACLIATSTSFFNLTESAEFEVVRRVAKDLGWRPAEVVAHKYEKDILALYIYHWRRLLYEVHEHEKMKEEEERIKSKMPSL